MNQIKIFHDTEDRIGELEHEINAWLRQSKSRVVQVFGNIAPQSPLPANAPPRPIGPTDGAARRFAPSDVLVMVLYDDGT